MAKTVFWIVAGITVSMANSVSAEIERRDFRITSEQGIELAIREVRDTADTEQVPIILLHGARVSGIPSFDLPVDGGSLAADLARFGHRAFIVDARGYGASSRPGQSGPPAGKPLSTSHEITRDIDAAVDEIRARTNSRQVALLGWATGGHWAGMYASLHPEKVSHLVVYNSLYGAAAGHPTLGPDGENADPKDRSRFNSEKFGAYRLNTADSLMPSWDKSIDAQDKATWRDPAVAEAYQKQALASDPTSAHREPAAFRSPSGAMEDSFYLASGRQLWDAASITANVLIIRAEKDFWSRAQDAVDLQAHLVNAADRQTLQHRPENRNRFSESTMRRFKELERTLCVHKDARRSNHSGCNALRPS